MPPEPTALTISYGPSFVPEESGKSPSRNGSYCTREAKHLKGVRFYARTSPTDVGCLGVAKIGRTVANGKRTVVISPVISNYAIMGK